MKILLDECIPRKLAGFFHGHKVLTVVQAGWKGIKNGDLLKKASSEFDVFISVDRNLSFQQNIKTLPLPIIVIHSSSIKLIDLQKFVPEIMKTIREPLSSKFFHLGV